jgi:hypothetical protein
VLAIFQHLLAIDKDVDPSCGILMGVFIVGMVLDFLRIKDHHVGVGSNFEQTAAL